ncbi:RagB/SusD family nutrient uptake outer membrane protein [Prevotella sp. KH2C16]|uniref:RagB/SusD family nutrient uptake outer membrane protein n=1 Tax=Prevotella sp. KH2C16 TaxID=1855325 RepID=UPI0008F0DBD9|nr:RagB/SusD family nutrient uptake outer membrane protein [Prevotella sp. KH2C16]SFG71972.1 Starch-binding associating with outer membrane [Prevotella sp. KH2C16]
MKKSIYRLLFLLVAAGLFTSCDNVLDMNSTNTLSDVAVWASESSADAYVTASYKTFSDVSQVANSRNCYYDSFSDLMKSTSWDQYNHGYNKALLQSSSFSTGNAGPFNCWEDCYTRIRRTNVLLADIDRYGGKFGEDWCNIRRAEARLCRAWSYYRLIRVYGGVVLRTDTTGVNGVDDGQYSEDTDRARMTEAESWDYVLDELSWAARYLPESWPTSQTGRATKLTAYALISRMALYAGKWQMVIGAANKCQNLGAKLVPDYAKLFQVDGGQDNSPEILFAIYYEKGSVVHNFDAFNRPYGDGVVYNTSVYGEHVPTAELADLYEFKDGTDFSWNTWSNSHSDPYTDREPRFKATILYNGATWESREIQSYVGGIDNFVPFTQSGATGGHTCTGYYLRKYLQEGNKEFVNEHSWQYDIVIRYAEVLLNKAEAYANLDYQQYRTKALDALNEVRSRVGLSARIVTDAPDKDAFMKLLRKERCVELAGEGLRFWDLKRWKLASNVINGQNAHGVRITRDDNGTYTYTRVECDGGTPRIFPERYYYLSIPTSETSNNKLCKDNPYW